MEKLSDLCPTVAAKAICLVLLALATCIYTRPVHAADHSADDIEKILIKRWNQISSLTADLTVEADYAFSPNSPAAHVTGKGIAEYLKKDGLDRSRIEFGIDLTETIQLARFIGIYDGKDAYITREFLGKLESEKIDQSKIGVVPPGGQALFNALRKDFELTALSPEKIDGKDAFVLEAKAKRPLGDFQIGKMRFFFLQQSGVVARVDVCNTQNVPLGTIRTSNVRINPPISEDRFKYNSTTDMSIQKTPLLSLPQLPFLK